MVLPVLPDIECTALYFWGIGFPITTAVPETGAANNSQGRGNPISRPMMSRRWDTIAATSLWFCDQVQARCLSATWLINRDSRSDENNNNRRKNGSDIKTSTDCILLRQPDWPELVPQPHRRPRSHSRLKLSFWQLSSASLLYLPVRLCKFTSKMASSPNGEDQTAWGKVEKKFEQ